MKIEMPTPLKPVRNLAWDSDSQRLCIVGAGKEKKGVFLAADGGTIGEVITAEDTVIGCAIRPCRPYYAATTSYKGELTFYKGPPFKETLRSTLSQRALYDVSFSPDGSLLAVSDGEGRIHLHNATTGESKHIISSATLQNPKDAHTASVIAVSWSADSKQLVSVSADKTARVWDVESCKLVSCSANKRYSGSLNYMDQKVGAVFGRNGPVVLAVDGTLMQIDTNSGEVVKQWCTNRSRASAGASVCTKVYLGTTDGQMSLGFTQLNGTRRFQLIIADCSVMLIRVRFQQWNQSRQQKAQELPQYHST
jgi:WD40 repeat protein